MTDSHHRPLFIARIADCMRGVPLRRRVALPFIALLAACATAEPAPEPVPPSACVIGAGPARARISIAVADRNDPLVTAQTRRTLVRLDCTGTPVADLALTWSGSNSAWDLTIDTTASYHDGRHVTAFTLAPAVESPAVAGIDVRSERAIRIILRDSTGIEQLAQVSVGNTGAYAERDGMLIRQWGDGPDTIDVRTYGRDPRTAIDARVDAFVTDDDAALAYARARTDYTTVALPWGRTYMLFTQQPGAPVSAGALAEFGEGAVTIDTRVPGSFDWTRCAAGTSAVRRDTRDIVYDRSDPIARSIAERIAALAWPADRTPQWLRDRLATATDVPRAVGLDAAGLVEAARTRSALAIVLSAPIHPPRGCQTLDPIFNRLYATPLLDTRAYLVHRSGIGRLLVDGSANVLFGRQ